MLCLLRRATSCNAYMGALLPAMYIQRRNQSGPISLKSLISARLHLRATSGVFSPLVHAGASGLRQECTVSTLDLASHMSRSRACLLKETSRYFEAIFENYELSNADFLHILVQVLSQVKRLTLHSLCFGSISPWHPHCRIFLYPTLMST